MSEAKVGLLGLYLKLYDDTEKNDRRRRIDGFYGQIAGELERRGLEVVTAPVCRLASEFAAATASFEAAGADAVVTLHLAYSPSLESIDALAGTSLPIIVLDTTPTWSYGPDQDPQELMYNHGIHGVQDMCNLLLRRGKGFEIAAGHWERSDVLDRTVQLAAAARMASVMRTARIGLIGRPFTGMGDFYVSPEVLKSSIGTAVVPMDGRQMRDIAGGIDAGAVEAEMRADENRFDCRGVDPEVRRRAVRTGLTVRRWLEAERLNGYSFNFLDIDPETGLETVPFLETSKLLARGYGYAGEGDTLTAALTAAVASRYPQTSFSEIFCPDWEHDRLYLSHMGEGNCDLFEGQGTLVEMDYGYSDVPNPVLAAGRFKAGSFVLVDLAPTGEGTYRLILSPARMVSAAGTDNMRRSVHGWFQPALPVADFLAEYSRNGGTHHLVISYGADVNLLQNFGSMLGFETVIIG